jgi:hypothetical protein
LNLKGASARFGGQSFIYLNKTIQEGIQKRPLF